MEGVLLLLNAIIILTCNSHDLRIDFTNVSKLVNFELISSEFQRVTDYFIWTWTNISAVHVQNFVIFVVFLFILYQLVLQRSSEKEVENILDQYRIGEARVMHISHFKKDVANLFSTIEIQSKDVHKKYKRAESMISKPDNCVRMRQDYQSMKHNWNKEFDCISRFDIEYLKGQKTSHTKVLLTMAKGFVDKELGIIKNDMAEEMLSLEQVDRDVRSLQNYFRK
ncbi:uncharacterized protein LOC134714475 [Mytilus trossulus]|uniref:uncharacterized protein LOC134714475 n=1 Tax=Mytilus trossulus TaxID=6551 RepID=UPI0030079624